MLINDLNSDLNQLITQDGRSKSAVARDMGIAQPNLLRLLKSKFVLDGFVKLLDVLGYDFKIVYVKKPISDKEPLVEDIVKPEYPEDLKTKSTATQRRERLKKLADTNFEFKI